MDFKGFISSLSALPIDRKQWSSFLSEAGQLIDESAGCPVPDDLNAFTSENPMPVEKFARILTGRADKGTEAGLETAARQITRNVWGISREIFAPLYLFNHCVNDCGYCSYRRDNSKIKRKKSGPADQHSQVQALIKTGYRNILLLSGELQEEKIIDYLADAVRRIRGYPEIERIGIEFAPMSEHAYQRLLKAGADYFVLFQEVYDVQHYQADEIHPRGDPKADYEKRLSAPSMAAEAGFNEIGIGSLFGLADPFLETLSLFAHARSLMLNYSHIRLRISVPRLQPAEGARFYAAPFPVDDKMFLRIIFSLRLAFPFAHLVLTAREPAELRNRLFMVCSSLGAGGKTSVLGYTENTQPQNEQFLLHDHRTLSQVKTDLMKCGLLPDCTEVNCRDICRAEPGIQRSRDV